MNTFINSLAEHIKSHYDLQKQELTVVFPNKRAAYYLRSRLTEIYDKDIWLPQMLSIQEAVTQWSGVRLIDGLDMLFELLSINSELSHSGSNILVFGSLAAQMAKDFDEIDQYDVDADHLFSYVYEEKKIGVWQLDRNITEKEQRYLEFFAGLKGYYERLRHRLSSQGKGYYGMITRWLSHLSDEELVEKTRGRQIIFAGFNALTPTEEKIIHKLYQSHRAEVVWDFDRYYVEDPHNEAGWFARKYIDRDIPWKPTQFTDHLLHDPMEIHLVESKGNTIQAKALQSLLQVELEENVAVVLADENLMIPVLNSLPDDPRYPSMKVSMGYPMKHTALNQLVNAILTLRRKGLRVKGQQWYIWPILRVLDLELLRAIFSDQEIGQLERYKAFILEKSIFVYQEKDFETYCPSRDLQQFMSLLTGSGNTVIDNSPMALLQSLTTLLTFISNKIQNEGKIADKTFLLNQVSEAGKTVNRLRDIIGRYDHYVRDLDEFEILYRLVASNTTIKLNNSSTDGLQLMGILEARNLSFNTFYMLGVNEGMLPAEKSYNSFIPFNIRRECHLPGYQEKQAVYAYHFYRQLQGARRMYFIYNSSSGELGGGEPSRFLLQLKYELAQRNPNLKIIEEVFTNKTEKNLWPVTLKVNKTSEVMEKLMAKIQTDNIRNALAPTSLSSFIHCPLQFYLKFLLKIKDNSLEEETQNNVIGTIVHNTLEELYRPYLNTLISKQFFKDVIQKSLPAAYQRVLARLFGQGLPDVGYNYLNKLTLDKLFKNYCDYEEADIARHELYLIATEKVLHTTLTVNGITCQLSGTADRIDRHDGIVRIIDYKTGLLDAKEVVVPEGAESLRDIPDKAVQLLIYKYLYLKEHPDTQPDQVTASLFGFKNQKVSFELKVEHQGLIDEFVPTMDRWLHELFTAMMDPSLPFTQPEGSKEKLCRICDFKDICGNTVTGLALADDR